MAGNNPLFKPPALIEDDEAAIVERMPDQRPVPEGGQFGTLLITPHDLENVRIDFGDRFIITNAMQLLRNVADSMMKAQQQAKARERGRAC